MEDLIKEINNIMDLERDGSRLSITFYSDKTVVFGIYEQEVPIYVIKDSKEVYLEVEACSSKLTADMLDELAEITRLIQKNIDVVIKCL